MTYTDEDVERDFSTVAHQAGNIARGTGRFPPNRQDRKTVTREEAAAKWKCSPGTIDKYAA